MLQSGIRRTVPKVSQSIDTFSKPRRGKIIKKTESITRRIGLFEEVIILAQQGDYFIVENIAGGKSEGIRIPKSFIEEISN